MITSAAVSAKRGCTQYSSGHTEGDQILRATNPIVKKKCRRCPWLLVTLSSATPYTIATSPAHTLPHDTKRPRAFLQYDYSSFRFQKVAGQVHFMVVHTAIQHHYSSTTKKIASGSRRLQAKFPLGLCTRPFTGSAHTGVCATLT